MSFLFIYSEISGTIVYLPPPPFLLIYPGVKNGTDNNIRGFDSSI